MKEKSVLHNEDGSVLIISLVILALLLVIGMSATTTSNIESLVTRNVEEYTVALYRAEAAAMEAVQLLNDATPDPIADKPDCLNPTEDAVTGAVIVNENYWETDPFPQFASIGNSKLLAGFDGIIGSLDMGKSSVYKYTTYGRGEGNRGGVVIVGVGYRRAF